MRTAIFDLDGTITRRDTLIAYVSGYLAQRGPTALLRLLRVIPAVARYTVDRDRGRLKGTLIRLTIGGSTRAEISAWNREFVDRLLRTGLHDAAINAIAQHRRAGDFLALLSASPDLYVPQIASRLGFDEVVCSEVLWRGEILDGTLTSHNRRGEEKVRCVAAIRSRHPASKTVAYGNARSDLPHLRLVDHGVLVNADAASRRAAERDGIECVEWS